MSISLYFLELLSMYHHVILECKYYLNPKKPKFEIKTDIQDIAFLRFT